MSQPHTTISTLIVRYVNGEATPEEKRQLDEWASLSAENQIWFKKFSDRDWLQKQAAIYNKIDLEERRKAFWAKVAARQAQQTQQTLQTEQTQQSVKSPEPVTGKPLTMAFYVRSAIVIAALIGACVYYFQLSSGKTGNLTAALLNNNTQQPASVNSDSQQEAHTTAAGNNDHRPQTSAMPITQTSTDNSLPAPEKYKLLIPAAGFKDLPLADGSKVWLNSCTDFSCPGQFKGIKRKVEMAGGEAFFEVAQNVNMPFQVTVNGVQFETTGACFNIQAHETDASKKVTVVSGTVRVTAGPYITYVKENQAALVEKNKPIAILKADTARAIAWKNRLFHFEKESMATVLRELSRWYDVTLSGNFNRKRLLSYKGSRDEKIPVVLKEIQRENPDFHYRLAGKKLILD